MRYVRLAPVIHNTATTIRHWQLRDLLWCNDSDPGFCYHVNDREVLKTNLAEKHVRVRVALEKYGLICAFFLGWSISLLVRHRWPDPCYRARL